MEAYYPAAAVTLLSGLLLFAMSMAVGKTRIQVGIPAPAMTGDPQLERTIRAHYNTLEWMPIFLPALWMFAFYVSAGWAAALGALWLAGRVVYFVGYRTAPTKRYAGFVIQALATGTLLIGSLFVILARWIAG